MSTWRGIEATLADHLFEAQLHPLQHMSRRAGYDDLRERVERLERRLGEA